MRPRRLGGPRWPRRLLAAHTAAVYLFLYAPIAVLVAFSFNSARQAAAWEGFTLSWYGEMLRDERLLHAVRNSLLVAALATVLATVIGTMAALAFGPPAGGSPRPGGRTAARWMRRQAAPASPRCTWAGRRPTEILLLLPVILPEVVLGAALLTLFGAWRLRLSLATVLVAHVVFSISYVALVVRARLAGLDPTLGEAARDLGAGGWEVFRRVTLPLALPGIAAGALLVFTLSIDDYVITSFVAGAGATTLPLHIYSLLKAGVTPEINAVSTALLLVTMALIGLAHRLLARDGGSLA
ncbi:MAG: ABC transporter permease [Acidobacteria bacterium]|nr:ABC transporter permease [Acidobacteriota bacterium]